MDPSNFYAQQAAAAANNGNKSPSKRQINSRVLLPFAQQPQQQQGQLPTAANGVGVNYPSQYMAAASSGNLMYSGLAANVGGTLNYSAATGNAAAQAGYPSTFQPLGNLASTTMTGAAGMNMNNMMFATGLGGGLDGGAGVGLGGLANGLGGAAGTGSMNFGGQMYPAGFSQLQANGMAGTSGANVNRMAYAPTYQAQAQAQAQVQQNQNIANVVAGSASYADYAAKITNLAMIQGYDMGSNNPTTNNFLLQQALLNRPQYPANMNVKMHSTAKPSPTNSPAIKNANLAIAGSAAAVTPVSINMNPTPNVASMSSLPTAPSVSSMPLPANMMSPTATASLTQGGIVSNMSQQVSTATANMMMPAGMTMANLQAAAASMNSGLQPGMALAGAAGMAGLVGSPQTANHRVAVGSQANHRFMPYMTPKQQAQQQNNYSALANALGAGATLQSAQRPQQPSQQANYQAQLQQAQLQQAQLQQAHLQQQLYGVSTADIAKSPAVPHAGVKPSPKIPPKTPTMSNPALQLAQQPQAAAIQQQQQAQFQQHLQHQSMQSPASSPELAGGMWNRAAAIQQLAGKAGQAASQTTLAGQQVPQRTPQQPARPSTPQQYQQLLQQQQQQQLAQVQQVRPPTPQDPPRPPTPQQYAAAAQQAQQARKASFSNSSSSFTTPAEVPSRPSSPAVPQVPQVKPSPSLQPTAVAAPNSSSGSATTTPARQLKHVYLPKTRSVDTYGGIELKYFEKFEIRPPFATINDLGTIDIRAVTMSLKSGMKLEVANALNILTMLAADRRLSLSLIQCDDLLDVLLDYLDEDFVRSFYEFDEGTDQENFGDGPENVNGGGGIEEMASREYTYAELFDLSLDEMKSVIPKLEDSSSELWLSRRERCLCIVNLLRNFSFMGENQEFLAKHPRFVDVLARTLTVRTKSEMADKWEQRKGGGYVNVREMDILDHRKSVLLILSNIVPFMTLRSTEVATALVALVSDFLRSGPETYYAQVAIEVWSKMSVSYDNRLVLETLDTRRRRWREQEEEDEEEAEGTMVVVALDSFDQTEDGFLHIERIWAELATAIRRDYFDAATGRVVPTIHSTQLAVLEMAMMGLYNIAVLSRDERTKARLVRRERGVAMMVLRLCVMLAETGNNGFSMVCRRGVELVRALVAGGDGGKRRSTDMEEVAGAGLRRKSRGRGTAVMAGLINVASLSEMLMQAMLRGMMERDILQELWDLVTVVDAAE